MSWNDQGWVGCRVCRTQTEDLNDRGKPRGWYRISLITDVPPGEADIRPGWYCSVACVCLAGMIKLGVDPDQAVAWLRGD